MGCRELCGDVHINTGTDTDTIGFETHCVGVSAGVGKGKTVSVSGSVNTPLQNRLRFFCTLRNY